MILYPVFDQYMSILDEIAKVEQAIQTITLIIISEPYLID
jgi:hypothetical protein